MQYELFQASKKQPGASGRLHRKETGEWVWSSEDEAGDDASSESDTESRPMNTLVSIGSSGSDHDESSEGDLPPVNLVLRMRFVIHFLTTLFWKNVIFTRFYIVVFFVEYCIFLQ